MPVKTAKITKFTSLRLARDEKAKNEKKWLLVEGHNDFLVTDDEAEVTAMRDHILGHVERIRAYGQEELDVPM
jgi:hypothetical protein